MPVAKEISYLRVFVRTSKFFEHVSLFTKVFKTSSLKKKYKTETNISALKK